MIRTFLPVTFLFSSVAIAASNPTPVWPKNLPTDFKSQTVEQAYCGKSAGFQSQALCEYLKKNSSSQPEGHISLKVNGALLVLNDGKRTVEIRRTKNEMQFEINKKIIDMTVLREPAQLMNALAKALPKVAVSTWWMNSAFAENTGSQNHDTMLSLLAKVTSFTVDQGLCDHARNLFLACVGNVDDASTKTLHDLGKKKLDEGKIVTLGKMDSVDGDSYLRWITSGAEDMITHLYVMEGYVGDVGKSEARARLKYCPSVIPGSTGKGDSDIDTCLAILAKRKKELFKNRDAAEKHRKVLENVESGLNNLAGKSTSAPAAAGVRDTGTR